MERKNHIIVESAPTTPCGKSLVSLNIYNNAKRGIDSIEFAKFYEHVRDCPVCQRKSIELSNTIASLIHVDDLS